MLFKHFGAGFNATLPTELWSAAIPAGSLRYRWNLNVGVGVQLYLTDHIFVRPEFDYHYVPDFTNQFGSNSVPEAMLWVGYSFGER